MKKMKPIKAILLSFILLLTNTICWSQASPAATATGKVGDATITISYSSPSVKGRQIWGALVPYNKVWRAGANKATSFQTDKDITVGGKALPAGKYSLFALVGENEWTIILNSQTDQWGVKKDGATAEDPTKDVLKITVTPKKSAALNEKLVYTINDKGFVLSWENLDVPVSIK